MRCSWPSSVMDRARGPLKILNAFAKPEVRGLLYEKVGLRPARTGIASPFMTTWNNGPQLRGRGCRGRRPQRVVRD